MSSLLLVGSVKLIVILLNHIGYNKGKYDFEDLCVSTNFDLTWRTTCFSCEYNY